MYQQCKVIAFDADDTLWINETYFREAENKFAQYLVRFETENKIEQELFKTEIKNLEIYGYGIKGFMLSMVECALKISNYTISQHEIEDILTIGKEMIEKPIELLDGVEEVLQKLKKKLYINSGYKRRFIRSRAKIRKIRIVTIFPPY